MNSMRGATLQKFDLEEAQLELRQRRAAALISNRPECGRMCKTEETVSCLLAVQSRDRVGPWRCLAKVATSLGLERFLNTGFGEPRGVWSTIPVIYIYVYIFFVFWNGNTWMGSVALERMGLLAYYSPLQQD